MFGVALDLKGADFRAVLTSPKPVLIGLAGQFVLLPAFTFLLVLAIKPAPSIALGMMLVAACPGGNISNFLTHYATGQHGAVDRDDGDLDRGGGRHDPARTCRSGAACIPRRSKILKVVALDPLEMLLAVFLLLGLPMAAGMWTGAPLSAPAARAHKPVQASSLVIFGLFVIGALAANWRYFLRLCRLRGLRGVPAQRPGPGDRLLRGPLRRPAGARQACGIDRGAASRTRRSASPDLQFLRRPRRHGHRHRLVGHLAHHLRPDRRDAVVAPAARQPSRPS